MKKSEMKIKITKDSLWIFLVIYFLLLIKSGFCLNEKFSSITAPVFLFFLILGALLMHVTIEKRVMKVVTLIIIIILINYILHGFPEINVIVLNIIDIISSLLVVSCIKETDFKRIFCKIVFLICIFSILGYLLLEIDSNIIIILPKILNSQGRVSYFAFFTMISDFRFTGANRIQGIFWEPGAFQMFIVTSFLLEHFNDFNFNYSFIRKMIYSLALLLTFSTTGIICLCLLWVLILGDSNNKLKWIRILLLGCAAFLFYISISDKLTGFWKYTLVDKVQQILNYKIGVRNQSSSRMDSIILPLKFFYDPIFGIGENGYKKLSTLVGHTMFTCTPVNYIVRYGLIFGIISFVGFYKFIKNRINNKIDLILTIIVCLISVSTENFMLNPFITVIILYGYTSYYKRRSEVSI